MAKLISWDTFFKIADPTGNMTPDKFKRLVIAMMTHANKQKKQNDASCSDTKVV